MKQWSECRGFFDFKDLYDTVVKEAPDGAVMVEVGVFEGRSLLYLREQAAASPNRIAIFGVDNGLGCPPGGPTANALALNMQDSGVPVILADSVTAADMFADKSLWFVFIDGAHDFESVSRDIAAWLPKVKDGGILAGDDYNLADVALAAAPLNPTTVGNSWVHRV